MWYSYVASTQKVTCYLYVHSVPRLAIYILYSNIFTKIDRLCFDSKSFSLDSYDLIYRNMNLNNENLFIISFFIYLLFLK